MISGKATKSQPLGSKRQADALAVRFRLKLKFIWRLEQGQHTSAPSAGGVSSRTTKRPCRRRRSKGIRKTGTSGCARARLTYAVRGLAAKAWGRSGRALPAHAGVATGGGRNSWYCSERWLNAFNGSQQTRSAGASAARLRSSTRFL